MISPQGSLLKTPEIGHFNFSKSYLCFECTYLFVQDALILHKACGQIGSSCHEALFAFLGKRTRKIHVALLNLGETRLDFPGSGSQALCETRIESCRFIAELSPSPQVGGGPVHDSDAATPGPLAIGRCWPDAGRRRS